MKTICPSCGQERVEPHGNGIIILQFDTVENNLRKRGVWK